MGFNQLEKRRKELLENCKLPCKTKFVGYIGGCILSIFCGIFIVIACFYFNTHYFIDQMEHKYRSKYDIQSQCNNSYGISNVGINNSDVYNSIMFNDEFGVDISYKQYLLYNLMEKAINKSKYAKYGLIDNDLYLQQPMFNNDSFNKHWGVARRFMVSVILAYILSLLFWQPIWFLIQVLMQGISEHYNYIAKMSKIKKLVCKCLVTCCKCLMRCICCRSNNHEAAVADNSNSNFTLDVDEQKFVTREKLVEAMVNYNHNVDD